SAAPCRTAMRKRFARTAALCLSLALSFAGRLGEGPGLAAGKGGGTEIPNEVRGVLYTVSGQPAAGAQVTLVPAGYLPDSGASTAGIFLAVTDTAERYAFTGVPDGYYNAVFDRTPAGAADGDM